MLSSLHSLTRSNQPVAQPAAQQITQQRHHAQLQRAHQAVSDRIRKHKNTYTTEHRSQTISHRDLSPQALKRNKYDMIRKAIDSHIDNDQKQKIAASVIRPTDGECRRRHSNLLKVENLSGKLVELSGCLQLTRASTWIREAQACGHLCAWLSTDALFYPPDLERNYVHLQTLITVQLKKRADLFHATETLLRSSAFKLLIIDLGDCAQLSLTVQSRLAALAKKHKSVLIFLTKKRDTQASLGALISMHLFSERHMIRQAASKICHRTVLLAKKIKGGRSGWKLEESYRAPLGLHSYPA